jgi:hypothetical protein
MISTFKSIPRARLRMMKILGNLPTADEEMEYARVPGKSPKGKGEKSGGRNRGQGRNS